MATNPIQAMIAGILAGETQSGQKKTSISELPATDTLKDADVIPVVQDDQTKKVTCEVLKRLLGGSISDEQIQNAVDAYLAEHPVQPGATAEQAAQIEENKNDISQLSQKLTSDYYTQTQIDAMEFITVEDIDTIWGATNQMASEVTF